MPRENPVLAALGSLELFQGLTRKELGLVAKVAKERSFKPDETLTEEGTAGGRFYAILEGQVSVSVKGREIHKLGPGETVGEMALIDGGPRTATVTAITPVRTITMASWNLRSLLKEHASITYKLLVEVCRRLREADASPVA